MQINKELILEHVGMMPIPATSKRFIAREMFMINIPTKIYLEKEFKKWFLGIVEEPVGAVMLHYSKIVRPSAYNTIISEFGGNDIIITTLSILYYLIERQQMNGGNGSLLGNGFLNIFFMSDVCGVTRAVNVLLYKEHWEISTSYIFNSVEWQVGRRVFHL